MDLSPLPVALPVWAWYSLGLNSLSCEVGDHATSNLVESFVRQYLDHLFFTICYLQQMLSSCLCQAIW